ncbi:MAG TPA: CAP domain-containing protein [Acidimicrobiia bacterium]|nr:CAP domain-containing protein [Acidimicrobiia bacterium]
MNPSSVRDVARHTLRRRLRVVAVVVALALAVSACMTKDQRTAFELVARSRDDRGVPALDWSQRAQDKAQAWAEYLAQRGSLAHSDLLSGLEGLGVRAVAENVGYAESITAVHEAFMRSSTHRANILGNYSHLGVGVAKSKGKVFVVHVFVLL